MISFRYYIFEFIELYFNINLIIFYYNQIYNQFFTDRICNFKFLNVFVYYLSYYSFIFFFLNKILFFLKDIRAGTNTGLFNDLQAYDLLLLHLEILYLNYCKSIAIFFYVYCLRLILPTYYFLKDFDISNIIYFLIFYKVL